MENKREKKTIRFKIKDLELKKTTKNILKSSILNPKFLLFIGLLGYLFIGLFSPKASAATMTSDNYNVEKRAVQIQPFVTEAPKPKAVETENFLSVGNNYTVTTNNQNAFSFTVYQDTINFGPLQPTNPVIRELLLKLSSNSGYQILTAADHPLQKTPGAVFIPDTTCDNGSCSEFTAAPWLNTLTYGFGYRTDTMEDSYYKPFADLSRNEAFQSIFAGAQAQGHEEKVTYKVNTSGTQETGWYTNTLFYIATPDF